MNPLSKIWICPCHLWSHKSNTTMLLHLWFCICGSALFFATKPACFQCLGTLVLWPRKSRMKYKAAAGTIISTTTVATRTVTIIVSTEKDPCSHLNTNFSTKTCQDYGYYLIYQFSPLLRYPIFMLLLSPSFDREQVVPLLFLNNWNVYTSAENSIILVVFGNITLVLLFNIQFLPALLFILLQLLLEH